MVLARFLDDLTTSMPADNEHILLLLDEFPLLGPMPVLADAFAFVAGFGLRLMLIMQSKAQLRDRDLYGPDKAFFDKQWKLPDLEEVK